MLREQAWRAYATRSQGLQIERLLIVIREMVFTAAMSDKTLKFVMRSEVAVFLDSLQTFEFSQKACNLIEHIIEYKCAVQNVEYREALFRGIGGDLYKLNLLSGNYVGAVKVDNATSSFNRQIHQIVSQDGIVETDFISGLVGIGKYLLDVPNKYQADITTIYNILLLRCEKLADFNFNTTRQRATNLGISHGLPGVLCFISEASIAGHLSRSEAVIGEIASYLLKNIQVNERSLFGYNVGAKKTSRVAWCYGDLSVSLALLKAAVAISDKELFFQATKILSAVSVRRGANTRVIDASLCHGSLGAAHTFATTSLWTKNSVASSASSYWLQNFLTHAEDQIASLKGGFSFLEGYAGVGLCLLSAISTNNRWSKILFMGNNEYIETANRSYSELDK